MEPFVYMWSGVMVKIVVVGTVTPLGVKHALAFQSIKHSASFHD
jgi:hypothetical protein